MDFKLQSVEIESPLANQVFALYRRHASTLGFLPRGAFDEFVAAGHVFVALEGDVVAGYLAYRIGRGEAVIVHLCVDDTFRSYGLSHLLFKHLLSEIGSIPVIRLSCRTDYAAARRWPKLGFINEWETPGRGAAGVMLQRWVYRVHQQHALYALLQKARVADRRKVVLDANVFYDLDDEDPRGEESRTLLADWVEGEFAWCVTAELRNEIARHATAAHRERKTARMRLFEELQGPPARIEELVSLFHGILPPARSVQDDSDRRQLAHAVAERAFAFLTRDQALLDHAHVLREAFEIRVMRPIDLTLELHAGAEPEAYQPARLAGTPVTSVAPSSAALAEDRFLRRSQGEPRVTWLARVREVLADPRRYATRVISSEGGDPFVMYAIDREQRDRLTIRILRVLSHPLAGTVLRKVLHEQVVAAVQEGRRVVVCEDHAPGQIHSALEDVGFRFTALGWVRATVGEVVEAHETAAVLRERLPEGVLQDVDPPSDAATAAALERRFWPLKVTGAGVASYIVPIRPSWAADLFDIGLAHGRLFGAAPDLALALENVYYSGAPILIPPGSRILWYVSREPNMSVMQVRATSVCEESVTGTAKELFGRFRRLGVYRWNHVCEQAGGPHEPLRAHRFSHVECFRSPVPWVQLQAVLRAHTGKENPIASPVRLDEPVFLDLYRRGHGV